MAARCPLTLRWWIGREETTKETKDAKTTDANKKYLKFGRSKSRGDPHPINLSLISRLFFRFFRVFRGLSLSFFLQRSAKRLALISHEDGKSQVRAFVAELARASDNP